MSTILFGRRSLRRSVAVLVANKIHRVYRDTAPFFEDGFESGDPREWDGVSR